MYHIGLYRPGARASCRTVKASTERGLALVQALALQLGLRPVSTRLMEAEPVENAAERAERRDGELGYNREAELGHDALAERLYDASVAHV